jgi:hypothetical protein
MLLDFWMKRGSPFPFLEKIRRARVRTMIQNKSRKMTKNTKMSKAMMALDILPPF